MDKAETSHGKSIRLERTCASPERCALAPSKGLPGSQKGIHSRAAQNDYLTVKTFSIISHHMNPSIDSKLIEKIRNLLKLADVSRGATPEEASAAMAKAQQLITKHKIDLMLLEETQEERQQFNFTHEYVVQDRTQRYDYDSNIARVLINCFGVKVLWSKEWFNGKMCHTYLLVGEAIDIELAKIAIPILRDALYRGVMAYLRSIGQKWTAYRAHGFYYGIERGYIEGSEQGRARAMREQTKHNADRYAIVLVNKDSALTRHMEETFKPKATRSHKKQKDFSWDAYQKGYDQGKALDITGKTLKNQQQA
jgi:hypothetical protein